MDYIQILLMYSSVLTVIVSGFAYVFLMLWFAEIKKSKIIKDCEHDYMIYRVCQKCGRKQQKVE